MALTHKILYSKINKVLQKARTEGVITKATPEIGRTRGGRDSFACKVVRYCNRVPLAVTSLPAIQKTLTLYFRPNMVLTSNLYKPKVVLLLKLYK